MTPFVFLRLLGVVYLIAFLSLYPQVAHLIGEHGILPAADYLRYLRRTIGARAYYSAPTLLWLNAGGAFMKALCAAGAALSIAVTSGFTKPPLLAALWVLYLSLFTAGQVFLSYQWDVLLLESGFLAIFLPLWPGAVVWLFRWLLFRLMFLSGTAKLLSGDPAWRNLTALCFHYETQPLPNRLSWYMHQLPAWFQKLSTLFMFFVELAAPFLYFGPRPLRLWAAGATILLQTLIQLTGNYTFFNLLSMALCVFLPMRTSFDADGGIFTAGHAVVLVLAMLIAVVSTCRLWITFTGRTIPKPLSELLSALAPFPIVNNYGLFAVMTTERWEIIIEGSQDGVNWREYEFKYKPGDIHRAPCFVAPHQPRLDWQMWFAALSPYYNVWFVNFIVLLLQGSPSAQSFLRHSSLAGADPPKYIRALLYQYQFTDAKTKMATGAWWKRSLLGEYLPPLTLSQNIYGREDLPQENPVLSA
ncbi:MAG TPA: lipase maturation factor family protein [Bryobacterales bacterium]|nr:lipase maturation factor family protein [Bryobacterales bacterium]